MSIGFDKRMVDSTWYNDDWPALNAEALSNLTVSTPELELPMVTLTAYSAAAERRLEPAGAKDCHISQYYTSNIQQLTQTFKAAHISLFSGRRL